MDKIIELNGKRYQEISENITREYSIVRTYSAGVFFGIIESKDGKEVILRNARRIWYWTGASSLSELAEKGTSSPSTCKFPIAVDKIILTEVIEILSVSEEAKKSIDAVKIWSSHV